MSPTTTGLVIAAITVFIIGFFVALFAQDAPFGAEDTQGSMGCLMICLAIGLAILAVVSGYNHW